MGICFSFLLCAATIIIIAIIIIAAKELLATVDALRALPDSVLMMVMMVVVMVMIVERGMYGGSGGEWTFLEKTAQKEKVHEDGGVYILSVVTELMKSKELNCANYHRNELWPGGFW